MLGYLYDPSLLDNLDSACENDALKLRVIEPRAKDVVIRPLCHSDYQAGYIGLLKQLTHVGDVSETQFKDTFKKMKALENMYYVTVIEDLNASEVVGAGTLLIEQKFIHDCGLRGRIEDIVISESCRGQQLGKAMVRTLTLLARRLNCYKVTLDCRDENKSFYESLSFQREDGNSNFMQIRFRE